MKLAKKPSNFIRQALEDLEVIEKKEGYAINMSTFHDPTDNICEVCLAGAVMANTLGCDPKKSLDPENFTKKIEDKLNALDCFRMGSIEIALDLLGKSIPKGYSTDSVTITTYRHSPEQFKEDMHALADGLQGMGL